MDDESSDKPAGKVRLLTLADLDRRTSAAKKTLALRDSLVRDLGGGDRVSTAEDQLCQRSAILGAMAEHVEASWLSGDDVDLAAYSTLVNAQRRTLSSIGLEKRAADITVPSVNDYLAAKAARKAAGDSAATPAASPATGASPS